MASSTTSPMASTSASRVSRFRLKPSASISVATPTSDKGIVTTGMTTERIDPRNRKITAMTMITASARVKMTSLMADRGRHDADDHRGLAVDGRRGRVVLSAELHQGDIAQADLCAVGGFHHH